MTIFLRSPERIYPVASSSATMNPAQAAWMSYAYAPVMPVWYAITEAVAGNR